ncbi:MAG TPA: hypothetical protein ENI97_15930 [Gammaproteobacteria bacterium]|nr:hypothetical protein [Gammaproteobacteria bacterium]
MKTVKFFAVFFLALALIACGGGGGGGTTTSNPAISVTGASIAEGDSGTSNLTFTISLSPAASSDVSIDYATSDGTATAGTDYAAASGTATISAGSTSTTVSVSVTGDTLAESNESFTLSLSNAVGATLATSSATGTINDDDAVTPLANLSVGNVNVTEGNSGTTNLTFTLSLDASSSSDITVDYATSNGTATAGSDYTAASGTATISAGNTSTTVVVSVTGDTAVESNETFTLTLSNAAGAKLAIATAIGTILNDDSVSSGPFLIYADDQSNLHAVDVNDSSKTYLVATGVTANPPSILLEEGVMILTGDFNVSTGVLNNFRPDTYVYFDAGNFWRVDVGAGSGLVPTQISSVGGGYVCYMDVLDNPFSPTDSYIVYVKGTDATACSTTGGQAFIIQVSNDSSTPPTSIPGGPYWGSVDVEIMETSATPGQVTGFLVSNSNDDTITRYDVNFGNAAVLKDGVSEIATFVDPGGDAPNGVSLFLVDGVLYSYTHNLSSAAVTSMHTISSGSRFDHLNGEDFACNQTHCFFVEINTTTNVQTLYMAAIDGSGSTPLGTPFTNDNIQEFAISEGRLYFTTAPKTGSGQSLYAVNQAGGTPAVVDSIATGSFATLQSAGPYLYYNVIDTSVSTLVSAKVLKDDNTFVFSPIANAAWSGLVISNFQINAAFYPSEFILAQDVVSPAGTKYTTYNASTVMADTVLGTINGTLSRSSTMAAPGSVPFFSIGIGDVILGIAAMTTSSAFQTDVIMGNKTIAGSLQNITNTATVNELPMF